MKYLIPLLAFSFLIGCDGEKSNERPSKDSPEEAFTKSSYNKRTRLLFLLLILIVPCVSAQEKKSPLRTWTSDIGTKIEAELVSIADGEVTLKTKTGRTLKVPLHKLSKADQEFAAAKSSPKEPTKDAVSVNPNLKHEVKGDEVTITGCDKKASGELIIAAIIEGKPVTSIEEYAFWKCTSLTSITIPNSVTSIGEGAFRNCNNLTSITIPNSVTYIGVYAFWGCTNLTTIKVGAENANYTDVEEVLFNKKKTLLHTYPAGKAGANYVIPNSVTRIWHFSFNGCSSLKSITIGNGVTSIGEKAFWNCTSLTALTFLGDAPKISNDAFNESSPIIYREADAKGWGDTFADRPVKLISEKP